MKMTIKQLAEQSGVSTRTLRYYDEIGLLAPAYIADNGYRYYGEQEMLLLQQILFFRALDFKLEDIKSIMLSDTFDQLESLQQHRQKLLEKSVQMQQLLKTIDKTILHLKGEVKMKEDELYLGFQHPEQLAMAAKVEDEMGERGAAIVEAVRANMQKMSLEEYHQAQAEGKVWIEKMEILIAADTAPDNQAVQLLVDQYYHDNVLPYCNPTGAELLQLCEISMQRKTAKEKAPDISPKFLAYFLEAMKVYVQVHKL